MRRLFRLIPSLLAGFIAFSVTVAPPARAQDQSALQDSAKSRLSSDITSAGTAQVIVTNPSPSGGTSASSLTFTINP